MTFYGEALGLDSAGNVSGAPLASYGAAIHYLYRDSDFATVTAGESFIAGMWPRTQLLASGDEAVLSWVVECGPGSAGTLRLHSGLDPSWSYADPAPLTESLGDHAVSGESKVVATTTSITTADLLAHTSPPALFVECIGGSVDVLQVRLRVWPPGGPQGAWAPTPGYTEAGNHFRYNASKYVQTEPDYSIPEDAWSATRSLFDGSAASTWQRVSAPEVSSLARVLNDLVANPTDPTPWAGVFSRSMAYLEFGPTLVTGGPTGTGSHPDVVPDDYQRSVRAAGGGALWTQFSSWDGGVRVDGTPPTTVTLETTELPLTLISGSEYAGPVPMATAGVSAVQGDLVPLPASPNIVVGMVTPEWFTAPSAAYDEQQSATLEGVAPVALVPDFEYWNPALPWVPERQPRFFVKDYEGDWRPVGFGKPASDTSRFHVWTPVGWYVECLDGETYSNAHPLKVKLYDGTWDTVAHMRPL